MQKCNLFIFLTLDKVQQTKQKYHGKLIIHTHTKVRFRKVYDH